MSGRERIAEAFARARADGRRAALMPYMMGGFPDPESSRAIAGAYADAGADLVELGVPFSDPLADGPVIHAAATTALAAGVNVDKVLEIGAELSRRCPVVVMCYANPILARGAERFLDALRDAGISGLIVPDLPLEESDDLLALCDARDIALVPLIAPTSSPERVARIGARARGFVYSVSLTGTTGERAGLNHAIEHIVRRVAEHTDVPVAVGFGISDAEQAAGAAAAGADGVIVGTRLVRAAAEADDPAGAVHGVVSELAAALR